MRLFPARARRACLPAVLAVLGLAAAARAQTASQSPAEPLHRESFADAGRQLHGAKERPQAVAQAVELAFGATTWAQIHISTMGPVMDLTRLYDQGYYKLELIELVLMSARAQKTLAQTVAKRRTGERLSRIAFDYGLDYDRLYEQALRVQDVVDRVYLPRFPQRKPRPPRDDQGYDTPYYYGP